MGSCAAPEKKRSKINEKNEKNDGIFLEGIIKGRNPKSVIKGSFEDREGNKSSNRNSLNSNSNNKTNPKIEKSQNSEINNGDKTGKNNDEESKKINTPDVMGSIKKSGIKDDKSVNLEILGSKNDNNNNINNDNEGIKSINNEEEKPSPIKNGIEERIFTNGNSDIYKDFDINKDYYLICGDCNSYITYIYSAEFNNESNDFKLTYKCQCEQNENENKEEFLQKIISDEKIMCKEHSDSKLKYFCETCKKQICRKCKECKDLAHDTKRIINNEVIPDAIMDTIKDKKDDFKGFDIFEKIFNFYKKTRLPEDQESSRNSQSIKSNKVEPENPFRIKKEETLVNIEEIKPEQNEQENKELKKSDIKNSKISENKNEQEVQKKSENDININSSEHVNMSNSKNNLDPENDNINGTKINTQSNINNIDDIQKNDDENLNKNENSYPLLNSEHKEDNDDKDKKSDIIFLFF